MGDATDGFNPRVMRSSSSGGGSSGNSRPDLSSVETQLHQIFENSNYHPTKFNCAFCATDTAKVLNNAGFDVDIVELQSAFPRVNIIDVKNPSGGTWTIARSGWHDVVRIKHQGQDYFLDSTIYQHYGLTPLSNGEYSYLVIASEDMVYFHSRNVGQTRADVVGDNPSLGDNVGQRSNQPANGLLYLPNGKPVKR